MPGMFRIKRMQGGVPAGINGVSGPEEEELNCDFDTRRK